MTALVILCSSGGAAGLCAAHLDGAALAAWSLERVCGKMGEWLIALAMLVFSLCDHDRLVLSGEADAGGDVGNGGKRWGEQNGSISGISICILYAL